MLISTKGRYALRVLIDMAEHNGNEYIKLKDIAERQEISEKYLESIVKQLVNHHIVVGLRGKGGGYKLSKAADESEYVLYYNDFSGSMDGLSVIQKTSATVSVSDGELVLDASSSTSSYARVLLPAILGEFGDYKKTAEGSLLPLFFHL